MKLCNLQPWELAVAVGSVIINAVLYGIYDSKKNAVIRFSMSVVFIFTTYVIGNMYPLTLFLCLLLFVERKHENEEQTISVPN